MFFDIIAGFIGFLKYIWFNMRCKLTLITLFLFVFAFLTHATGMNRVVLKQNNGKAKFSQEMFYHLEKGTKVPYINTIFVIQSDFELADDITIPPDCILEFEGGSLRNGKIDTNGCYIDAPLYQVFDNVVFNSLNNQDSSIEVVDNIYVKVLKDKSFINKKTNTVIPRNSIVNRRYIYRITGKASAYSKDKSKVTITVSGQKYTIAEITSENKYNLKYSYYNVIGIVNKSGAMASGIVDKLDGITFYIIEPLSYSSNSTVKNKEIHPEWFGAKGDNKHEDSYAYNTALDLAYYSDSKVVIGNGIYRIDDALVIHTHTNLEGVVPTVEYPVKGCFSVNTDVAMLVFDKYNPTGSYNLENFGFIPYSNKYKSNYTGIKIYHSQNHACISNVGFSFPKTGIDVDAIGGVQLLRFEDISLWGEKNKGIVALSTRYRLSGWYNANYFRPAFVANCTMIKSEGGSDNTLDGGSCETNSRTDYLIELDKAATLIVRSGQYRETGRVAKLRNSSKLIIEGECYFIGNIDRDESSYVVNMSRNIQTRKNIINNNVIYNDVVLSHLKVFSKKTSLWYETVSGTIVKPIELSADYQARNYNGRRYVSGKCRIPMGDVDIKGKTVAVRILSKNPHSSETSAYPLVLNTGHEPSKQLSQTKYSLSRWEDNTSFLYITGDVNIDGIERGEQYVFLPSKKEKFLLNNIVVLGTESFLVSDVYVLDIDSKYISGNEQTRIMDVLNSMNSYAQEDGLISGYNKGISSDRPVDLKKEDAGFEYFDVTLHKPIFWTGDASIGDNGWVDALGNHPARN